MQLDVAERRDTEITRFQQHKLMEHDAANFAGGILNRIREKVLPNKMIYDERQRSNRSEPRSISFTNLCYLSDYIKMRLRDDDGLSQKMLYEIKTAHDYAMSDQSAVGRHIMNGMVRRGITEMIWRITDCIRFAEENTVADLERFIQEIATYTHTSIDSRIHDTREETIEQTWRMRYIPEWKKWLNDWKKYQRLLDSVFPDILCDIPKTLGSLINTYPSDFWVVFWDTVRRSPSQHPSLFDRYLIHTIAPQVLYELDGGRQVKFCGEGLQKMIDYVKMNEGARFARPIEEVLSRGQMEEALIATNATVYQPKDLLGHDTLVNMYRGETEEGVRAYLSLR